jgi:hypothetical protein
MINGSQSQLLTASQCSTGSTAAEEGNAAVGQQQQQPSGIGAAGEQRKMKVGKTEFFIYIYIFFIYRRIV